MQHDDEASELVAAGQLAFIVTDKATGPAVRIPRLEKDCQPIPVTADAQALSRDQVTEPLEAIPAKPEHKVGQLTTGELARERSRLEAALHRPFAAEIKRLLRARLDAVLAEQAERKRRREADTAAAKAERPGYQ
jgi:hypothetical protein